MKRVLKKLIDMGGVGKKKKRKKLSQALKKDIEERIGAKIEAGEPLTVQDENLIMLWAMEWPTLCKYSPDSCTDLGCVQCEHGMDILNNKIDGRKKDK